jgi:hypothetical protein
MTKRNAKHGAGYHDIDDEHPYPLTTETTCPLDTCLKKYSIFLLKASCTIMTDITALLHMTITAGSTVTGHIVAVWTLAIHLLLVALLYILSSISRMLSCTITCAPITSTIK